PFHHDDLPARLGAVHRQRLARLAAADHEQVDVLEVVLTHGVSLSWSGRATSGRGGPSCGAWAARLRRGSDWFGVVLAPVPEVRSTGPSSPSGSVRSVCGTCRSVRTRSPGRVVLIGCPRAAARRGSGPG